MKIAVPLLAILALAACDTSADMLGDPNLMIDAQKGHGSTQRSSTGADNFTYVAPHNSHPEIL